MKLIAISVLLLVVGCSADGGVAMPHPRVDAGPGETDLGGGGFDAGPSRGDSAVPSDDLCGNGLDDNGNGAVDEGCSCSPGTTQECYPGDPVDVGRGPCERGTQGCDGAGEFGTWTECVGAVVPGVDGCGDRVDDDCNGTPDDGPDCVCAPSEMVPCYDGPAGTRGVGICLDGVVTCDPTPGVGWGACLDQVLPRMEICGNGRDDDCNGAVDDGSACACMGGMTRPCYSGPSEEIGVGQCRAGMQMCLAGGTMWTACVGEVGPSADLCDGIDNDCNGTTDDGCPTIIDVAVMLDGDCVTARCPPEAPYPVGCDIVMAGSDPRGCVASTPTSPVVYFQEGDNCGAGRVTGTLRCSNEPGAMLDATTCRINKPTAYYPASRTGCP